MLSFVLGYGNPDSKHIQDFSVLIISYRLLPLGICNLSIRIEKTPRQARYYSSIDRNVILGNYLGKPSHPSHPSPQAVRSALEWECRATSVPTLNYAHRTVSLCNHYGLS